MQASGNDMTAPKDKWDKADILVKAVVPIAVGALLLVWNSQRTTAQTATAMVEIAVGILSSEVSPDDIPLRQWAISVLQNPSDPPPLSLEASDRLQLVPLPAPPSSLMQPVGGPFLPQAEENIRQWLQALQEIDESTVEQ